MKTLSAAWKWFGSASLLGVIVSAVLSYHLVSGRLAQIGGDPDLAPPTIMVAATSLMTFFGILIPIMALVGVVIVILDGYSRGRTKQD
ncbi:hypothetical protein CU669_18450 [Paramagnetospirillum kuznetsovii]|uniref:Uncharacterized protein n=1 Tax=Paramagnetospirillum kuznetsovii TaxID=2053833 RepID=A0A364NTL8_9PROT|nr:hypothetical protein [Paramagnetospirillum kuznetsovii]RAU20433.1 hypothetical protein CU669_18450 [Paramagnetospirillum kuznetsovii]